MLRFFLHTNKIDHLSSDIQPFVQKYEECIILKISDESISDDKKMKMECLLSNFFPVDISQLSSLPSIKDIIRNFEIKNEDYKILTIGPRPSFKTSWCSNVIDLFSRIDIHIDRVEKFAPDIWYHKVLIIIILYLIK